MNLDYIKRETSTNVSHSLGYYNDMLSEVNCQVNNEI